MKLIILSSVLLLWLNHSQAFRYPLPNNFYNYRHRNNPKPAPIEELKNGENRILEKPLPPQKVQLILEMIASRLEELKNLPLMMVTQKKSEESGEEKQEKTEKSSMRLNRMM